MRRSVCIKQDMTCQLGIFYEIYQAYSLNL